MIKKSNLFNKKIIIDAIIDSLKKVNPINMLKNPIMFIVEIGSIVLTIVTVLDYFWKMEMFFDLQLSVWLWFTVLFANFAESIAEGKGKAHAQSLRKAKSEIFANKIVSDNIEQVPSTSLLKDDMIIIKDGEIIPCDSEIINGVGLVDESAITGESAPVVRESGGDRNSLTGGTKLLSGTLTVKVVVNPGESFLDQMIKMVESAKRQKTPNEQSLEILLIGLSVLFLVVVITLKFFALYLQLHISIVVLIVLLVCLMPTTIGGLLPAIGIAGMDKLLSHNVIALSGKAVEASGDVNYILLDKTGTITLGNRMASEFIPVTGIEKENLIIDSVMASLADETPEGRSIIILAKSELNMAGSQIRAPEYSTFVPFTAESKMSGIDIQSKKIRKGAVKSIEKFVTDLNGTFPEEAKIAVDKIAKGGGTPLVVCENNKVLGVIHLKDILKRKIRERLDELHQIGIKSIMITGDNPLTAASIAAEAGVFDYVAEATPKTKLELIRKYQTNGNMVAMIGDGTNDAPALAQADVAVAMNSGTQAAKEASNMIDLDSNPTKLLDIVKVGKEILITRGALTTFSIANDIAKYFAIIPAIFLFKYHEINVLNIMHLTSPKSAILSATIFNAIIIPLLIPLALKGVKLPKISPLRLLMKNLLIYGLGGIILPFLAIKLIDLIVVALKLI